ncbi:hypothetical protein L3X38_018299 [Prunus dulcis]|uniref:Uncharacterized protein n=1 Tax=Prunus dulcis TaxID=3755 RepID=A0AAD4WAR1_PRUDU|nr:hypothetical protein L3X38_018299 [Prunus dulcis]
MRSRACPPLEDDLVFRYADAGGSSAVIAVLTGIDESAQCSPYQMNPNVYRTMLSVQELWWRTFNTEPTINQVLHCFLLKRSPYRLQLPLDCKREDNRE